MGPLVSPAAPLESGPVASGLLAGPVGPLESGPVASGLLAGPVDSGPEAEWPLVPAEVDSAIINLP